MLTIVDERVRERIVWQILADRVCQLCGSFVKPLQGFATAPLLEEIEAKKGRNTKVLMNRKEFGGERQRLCQKKRNWAF